MLAHGGQEGPQKKLPRSWDASDARGGVRSKLWLTERMISKFEKIDLQDYTYPASKALEEAIGQKGMNVATTVSCGLRTNCHKR
jgi:hypothetical protein